MDGKRAVKHYENNYYRRYTWLQRFAQTPAGQNSARLTGMVIEDDKFILHSVAQM